LQVTRWFIFVSGRGKFESLYEFIDYSDDGADNFAKNKSISKFIYTTSKDNDDNKIDTEK